MHISNTEDRRKQSLDRHGLLLFEGTRILKKYETKQCVSKNFKKSKSVDYKKLWKQALDGYAGKSRRNILKVSLNDTEFKGFKVSSLKKGIPRPVTAKEVRYFCYLQPFLFEK